YKPILHGTIIRSLAGSRNKGNTFILHLLKFFFSYFHVTRWRKSQIIAYDDRGFPLSRALHTPDTLTCTEARHSPAQSYTSPRSVLYQSYIYPIYTTGKAHLQGCPVGLTNWLGPGAVMR